MRQLFFLFSLVICLAPRPTFADEKVVPSLASNHNTDNTPEADTRPRTKASDKIIIQMKSDGRESLDLLERTVDSFCECSKPASEVLEMLRRALENGDADTVTNLQSRLPNLATDLHKCRGLLQEQINRHKQSQDNFAKEVKQAIHKKCPQGKGMP